MVGELLGAGRFFRCGPGDGLADGGGFADRVAWWPGGHGECCGLAVADDEAYGGGVGVEVGQVVLVQFRQRVAGQLVGVLR